MPFTVGAPVSPSQQSPGVFSMQVQFQQDPQTGLFRMIPMGTPAFSPSPALSGSPLLYSPSHPMSSPQQHSSPFYPINSSLSSPQRQVDTSSDPENGDIYRNVAIPDTRRDPHRRTAAPSNKKSANSKRLERRLLSDSESSESSVFTPKPSGINSDKFPSKPGRLKTRSQSSTNLEKNKKHSKRSSADPVLGHREGGRLIDKSSNHSSRSSKSTDRGKLKASSASKSNDVRGLKQAAAPASSSPMTVSSPSRDSGVHMRYSMSSGEELPVTKEVSEPSLVLKRVIRHIRHAFAFDGYLENGVEALQMAEYITALAHLSWSTFSSAVTEKYCDLYWEEELLESLYEEINCKKVEKSNLKLPNDLSDSPKRETKQSLKKSQVKSKKSPAASMTGKTSAEIQTSKEKENALDCEKSHTARSDQSSSSTERKPNTNSQLKKTPNGVTKSYKHDETDTLPHSSPRSTSSSSLKKSSKDGENKQSHASPNCIKDDKKSSSGRSKSSSRQRRSDNHVQDDKIIEPEQQKEEFRNDPRKDEKNSSVSSESNNSGDSHQVTMERTDSASDNKTRQVIDTSPRKSNHAEIPSFKSEDGDACNNTPNNSLDERGSLISVQKCSTFVNEGASPLLSARTSQRSSSSLFGSLQSLNNSLSLSESSYLQSPQKADSDISEVSSTPTAFHIRRLLDSAITRSSSNASLTSFSSGSSSNQGPSCRSLSSQGHGGNQKLKQALMYGEDSFQRDVIEYSRRLEGKNVERKITEVEQQISVERKMRGKTERFYQKLLESQNNNNNKGAETKNKLSKVWEQLEEMNAKMTFLDSVRCYLELAFAEQWGLDHSLLHSFAISQKPMHLQPHSDNHMLQMKTSRGGTSLLQAGDPQGLFAYLFAKHAVMEGYLYHFLYIFRYLSKRQNLLTFIMDKFQAAECLPRDLEECRTQITLRTIDIFHVWLEGFFEVDFRQDPELLAEVISFISNKLVGVNQQGQGLLQLIDRKEKQEELVSVKTADKSEEDWPGNLPRQNLASTTSPWLSRKENKDKLSVGGIIACFSKRSSKNQDSAYLPVMALNKDGFSLSEHTSNGLAEQLTLIQQAQLALISKFINTAKSCYDMRNFATCVQVMDGLNNLIVRQVPAWKNIPSKVVSIYEELEAAGVLLKGDCDFLIRGDHHKTLPTLPCVHLVLMHIQQLEIGGFKLANGMYKWPKLKSIAECVDQVRVFQEHRYTLNSDEVLQRLLKTRIEEFRNSDIHILAASNHANFHQFSSEKGSKKLQSALQRVKANLH
ncbi:Protein very KIND [Apostichopus japonicus]|uniref:Protein very KIND n=1 Tax=Stichopus japonicus TaxID=307972 RepID=A0A2G8JII3_STIJA|nr:Protein very KIND [Apostichopus japonicus]